ncbi:hypothetical protein ACSMFT_09525 [Ectopseudomonas oleovorans]|uniref:hypothetical protein n=1 Tax=Ectopseudomonas oleovorans TaxID=301 RepID=UPI003F1BEF40
MTTETTDKAEELRQRLIRIFQLGQFLEDEPEHDPDSLAEIGLELGGTAEFGKNRTLS